MYEDRKQLAEFKLDLKLLIPCEVFAWFATQLEHLPQC